MNAIEIEFLKNRSRFKSLHSEDQVRLMNEFKRFGDKLLKNIITKKKKGLGNESEYFKS